jgi:hypothetical protein
MNVSPIHVTGAEIDQFQRRQLSGDALLAFTDHLAGCDECRRRVLAASGVAAASQSLHEVIGVSGDEHVEEAEIQLFVDGSLGSERRREISAHLDRCQSCAEEVRDLEVFAAKFGRSDRSLSWWTYGLAAAAVLVLGVGLAWQWRAQPTILAGLEALAPADRDRVREAIDGRLSLPSSITDLNGKRGTLLGTTDTPAFRLVMPIGTVVLGDHPTLRWTPLAGAASYIVTLQDQTTGETINSGPLTGVEWTVEPPLTRGGTYAWQVAGSIAGGKETVAPLPPDPEAKFKVLDAQEADRLGRLPASHLVRGVLYANAGLLDDAERELMALSVQDPDSGVADRLLKQIRGLRP